MYEAADPHFEGNKIAKAMRTGVLLHSEAAGAYLHIIPEAQGLLHKAMTSIGGQ